MAAPFCGRSSRNRLHRHLHALALYAEISSGAHKATRGAAGLGTNLRRGRPSGSRGALRPLARSAGCRPCPRQTPRDGTAGAPLQVLRLPAVPPENRAADLSLMGWPGSPSSRRRRSASRSRHSNTVPGSPNAGSPS
eukprot:179138-Alexandrium_andersonii.AAC.1